MRVVVVANPKGGVGKSTLATHIAGHWARQGHAVHIGDADRQQTSRTWLSLRPESARPIRAWDASDTDELKPPPRASHVVFDTPAGLHGRQLKQVLKKADKLLIPLQPSIFDIYATRAFVDDLLSRYPVGEGPDIGVVGMRVDARTISAEQLQAFVDTLGLPVLGHVRDTQVYIHLAARGLTLFDIVPARVAKDLEQWQPICQWLDR